MDVHDAALPNSRAPKFASHERLGPTVENINVTEPPVLEKFRQVRHGTFLYTGSVRSSS
jgi:hypothetical protein